MITLTETVVEPPPAPIARSPQEQELERFEQLILAHPILLDCQRHLRQAVALPEAYDILMVVGPAGVGKTTLMSTLLSPTATPISPAFALPSGPGVIPVVAVRAHTGKSFLSRWRSLLLDILQVVNAPLFEVGRVSNPTEPRSYPLGHSLDRTSIAQLLSLVNTALGLRQTRAVIVDEVQHLAPKACSAGDFNLMVESLKDLGSNTKMVLVLCGSYDLLEFASVSAQFARRDSTVHFRRYDISDEKDLAHFKTLVFTFCKAAPTLLPAAQFSNLMPYLYCGSMGCTGVLRKWLYKAIGEALARRSASVTRSILEATAHLPGRLKQIRTEIEDGEARFTELESEMDDFMDSVLAKAPKGFKPATSQPAVPPPPSQPSPPKPPRRPKPGKRNLVRDKVDPPPPPTPPPTN
jgi:archaellum biogenesis ATPase FlaH